MVKSMTGFGRGEYSDEKRNIVCEIKSVNHRYSEVSVKMPRRYMFCEEDIKKAVKAEARRGKIDCSIMVENVTESDFKISLNRPVVAQYMENLSAIKEEFGIGGEIDIRLISGLPEVMKQIPEIEDENEIKAALLTAVEAALKALTSMRLAEGAKLAEDLLMRGDLIRGIVANIETRAEEVPKEYARRLKDRIADLLDGAVEIPEEKIAVEAAIFADKCNITEEITRLKSHLDQLKTILAGPDETKGKKLDFLVQEMNREANTIGSKANDIEITNRMLDIKAEIEKIREQVQNIE